MPPSSSTCQFHLPDLFTHCTLKASTNPYYKEAATESRAWINSYGIFTDRKRTFFIQGQNELLCSHVYQYAGYEQFRTTSDFVNLLFVVDEVSDDQNGKDARAAGRVFMKYPDCDDGSVLAKITKIPRSVPPPCWNKEQGYTECVATEAGLRERGEVLDLTSFLSHRRNNRAALLCFSLVEYILGIEIYENEVFMDAYWAACDHICWGNDIYSYDLEQSRRQAGNNIVTVLMEEKCFPCKRRLTILESIVTTSPTNTCQHGNNFHHLSAQTRCALLMLWEIGWLNNFVWSFKTFWYFGVRLDQVKKAGIFVLHPREVADESCSESESDEE